MVIRSLIPTVEKVHLGCIKYWFKSNRDQVTLVLKFVDGHGYVFFWDIDYVDVDVNCRF